MPTTVITNPKQQNISQEILIGNGTHQAICEAKCKLFKSGDNYQLILPDGYRVNAVFRHKKLIKKYVDNIKDIEDGLITESYILGYPKVNKDGILKKIAIVQINEQPVLIEKNNKQSEIYKLTGVWTKDNIVIVQRNFQIMKIFFQKNGKIPTYNYPVNCPNKFQNKLVVDDINQIICNRNKQGKLVVINTQ